MSDLLEALTFVLDVLCFSMPASDELLSPNSMLAPTIALVVTARLAAGAMLGSRVRVLPQLWFWSAVLFASMVVAGVYVYIAPASRAWLKDTWGWIGVPLGNIWLSWPTRESVEAVFVNVRTFPCSPPNVEESTGIACPQG